MFFAAADNNGTQNPIKCKDLLIVITENVCFTCVVHILLIFPTANNITMGQLTFFGNIESASTPNSNDAKAVSPDVRWTPPKKKTTTGLMFRCR